MAPGRQNAKSRAKGHSEAVKSDKQEATTPTTPDAEVATQASVDGSDESDDQKIQAVMNFLEVVEDRVPVDITRGNKDLKRLTAAMKGPHYFGESSAVEGVAKGDGHAAGLQATTSYRGVGAGNAEVFGVSPCPSSSRNVAQDSHDNIEGPPSKTEQNNSTSGYHGFGVGSAEVFDISSLPSIQPGFIKVPRNVEPPSSAKRTDSSIEVGNPAASSDSEEELPRTTKVAAFRIVDYGPAEVLCLLRKAPTTEIPQQTTRNIQLMTTDEFADYISACEENPDIQLIIQSGHVFQINRPPVPDSQAANQGAELTQLILAMQTADGKLTVGAKGEGTEVVLSVPATLQGELKDLFTLPADMVQYAPRYIAQLDHQRYGPGHRGTFDEEKTYPYEPIEEQFCGSCDMTWMLGRDSELYGVHPYHNTLKPDIALDNSLDGRTLVVHIAGHFMTPPVPGGATQVSYAIYFGPNSKYNRTGVTYMMDTKAGPELAEVCAALMAICALRQVRKDWHRQVKEHEAERAVEDLFKTLSLQPTPKKPQPVEESALAVADDDESKLVNKSEEVAGADDDDDDGGSEEQGAEETRGGKTKRKGKKKGGKGKRGKGKKGGNKHGNKYKGKKPQPVAKADEPVKVLLGPPCKAKPVDDFRALILTDSGNFHTVLCDTVREWTYDDQTRTFSRESKKAKPGTLRASDQFVDLYDEIVGLTKPAAPPPKEYASVDVHWYKVPASANTVVRKMAADLLSGYFDAHEQYRQLSLMATSDDELGSDEWVI